MTTLGTESSWSSGSGLVSSSMGWKEGGAAAVPSRAAPTVGEASERVGVSLFTLNHASFLISSIVIRFVGSTTKMRLISAVYSFSRSCHGSGIGTEGRRKVEG